MAEERGAPEAGRIPNLEERIRTMGACIEMGAMIASTLDFNELISLVMEKTRELMDAEACSVLLYNPSAKKFTERISLHGEARAALREKVEVGPGQGIAGWAARSGEAALVSEAREDPRFYAPADEPPGFSARSLIAAPIAGRGGLIGVAEVMNPRHKEGFDRADMEVLETYVKQVAVAIENARYHETALRRERLRNELEIASALQRSFLPDPPVISRGNLRVSAFTMPAASIGGDFFDYIEQPEGTLGVFVGDVSGKGISGALYMARMISDFRYIALTAATTKEALERLNSRLSKAPRGMFLTATYILAETRTGRLHLSVAGHPPAVWLKEGGLKVLDVPAGPPLGIMPAQYPASTVALSEGDRLILVTDGAFEARDRDGRMLGFRGLVDFLKKRAGEADLLKSLAEHIKAYSAGAEMADDITVVELAYGGRA